MKRSSMPPRSTPLASVTPLRRTSGPVRTPMAHKKAPRTSEEVLARAGVSARSGGRCEIDPRDAATDWSHRVAKGRGGLWRVANGIDSCRRHHEEAHDQPVHARALGWHVRTGQDPAAVPVLLAVGWVLLADDGSMTPIGSGEAA